MCQCLDDSLGNAINYLFLEISREIFQFFIHYMAYAVKILELDKHWNKNTSPNSLSFYLSTSFSIMDFRDFSMENDTSVELWGKSRDMPSLYMAFCLILF